MRVATMVSQSPPAASSPDFCARRFGECGSQVYTGREGSQEGGKELRQAYLKSPGWGGYRGMWEKRDTLLHKTLSSINILLSNVLFIYCISTVHIVKSYFVLDVHSFRGKIKVPRHNHYFALILKLFWSNSICFCSYTAKFRLVPFILFQYHKVFFSPISILGWKLYFRLFLLEI
jgi:hypothetical protein